MSHTNPPPLPSALYNPDMYQAYHASLEDRRASIASRYPTSVVPANLTVRSSGPPRHSDSYGRTLSNQDLSFFDFDPPAASYQAHHGSGLNAPDRFVMGSHGNHQLISPPHSAVFSPKVWPNPSNPAYLHGSALNVLTDIKPANSRMSYGQVTPTDDERSEAGDQAKQQPRPVKSPPAIAAKTAKRKKGTSAVDPEPPSTPPPKSLRKDGSDWAPFGTLRENSSSRDIEKRSKFLERNRLAASKCRQKKKQWVENLEAKVRNLQAQSKHLNIVLGSLKNEILYLKVEMIRHKDCEGSNIQKLIMGDRDAFAEAVEYLERSEREEAARRSGSRPPGRLTLTDPVQLRRNIEKVSLSDPGLPLDDSNLAEALLQDEHFQDTSDEDTSELAPSVASG